MKLLCGSFLKWYNFQCLGIALGFDVSSDYSKSTSTIKSDVSMKFLPCFYKCCVQMEWNKMLSVLNVKRID